MEVIWCATTTTHAPLCVLWVDQDTCGVHNLHAVPGALGGLASVVVALAIPASAYGGDIGAMVSYHTYVFNLVVESISST